MTWADAMSDWLAARVRPAKMPRTRRNRWVRTRSSRRRERDPSTATAMARRPATERSGGEDERRCPAAELARDLTGSARKDRPLAVGPRRGGSRPHSPGQQPAEASGQLHAPPREDRGDESHGDRDADDDRDGERVLAAHEDADPGNGEPGGCMLD